MKVRRRVWSRLFVTVLTAVFVLAGMPAQAQEPDLPIGIAAGESAKEVQETAAAPEMGLTAASCILMEASTGTVLYEKNSDARLSPASITKIMTLILIFDALEQGKISLTDSVVTSEYAASMGGSQVFLEAGESQSVETLIKCIVVASGNDASVSMAEYIAGSETEFVSRMNARAEELGMENTHFEDCCGLTDSDGHYTSARDVAIMSRELSVHYPQIHQYSTIWMENITHTTARGSEEFGLANTNKLLKQYPYTTGLKTGSTGKAKYCVSATAEKDGIELIAVIMAAADYKVRFEEARSLLGYGFANCRLYSDSDAGREALPLLAVDAGEKDEIRLKYGGDFSWVSVNGEDLTAIEKTVVLPEFAAAPLAEGEEVGKLSYRLNGSEIGSVPILTAEEVKKADYGDYLKKIVGLYLP